MRYNYLNRLFFLVAGVYLNVKRKVESLIAPYNLTYPQYGVLSIAASGNLSSQKAIADALDTDTTTVTVIVDSLEKKGFVDRIQNTEDRRTKVIRPTEAGIGALREATRVIDAYRSKLLPHLNEEEVRVAIGMLDQMYDFLKSE